MTFTLFCSVFLMYILLFIFFYFAGGTFWCNNSLQFWYEVGVFVKSSLFYSFLIFFLWFPEAHWCIVQWGLVVCHEKEKKYADMLWSDFYFQMTVLLTTIHIIHIYNRDTKEKKSKFTKICIF